VDLATLAQLLDGSSESGSRPDRPPVCSRRPFPGRVDHGICSCGVAVSAICSVAPYPVGSSRVLPQSNAVVSSRVAAFAWDTLRV